MRQMRLQTEGPARRDARNRVARPVLPTGCAHSSASPTAQGDVKVALSTATIHADRDGLVVHRRTDRITYSNEAQVVGVPIQPVTDSRTIR